MRLLLIIFRYIGKICLLLLFPIIVMVVDVAYCAERTYYSIHLASFKDLRNANGYVNTLSKKGKMVFWKKADVPGKGEFYRVYLGKYIAREKAVEFWNKLNSEGSVSYFGVHKFKEAVLPPKIEKPPAPTKPVEEDALPEITPTLKKERFVDNRDGTVTDSATNLMWVKNGWRIDFVSAMKWQEAVKKVEAFRHRGYTDWRLPTIKEWKSLIDPKKEFPALVEPNPFENIIVHMPYWSKTEFNYGHEDTGMTKNLIRAYTVMLYYGRVNHRNKSNRAFVLPVRSVN